MIFEKQFFTLKQLQEHSLFWITYLILESYLVFAIKEWGIQSFSQSILYHGSLLIPRILIAYYFVYVLFKFYSEKKSSYLFTILTCIVYLIFSLFIYRAFLNLISWPLFMHKSPSFDIFNLRLSSYSFLKMATPLSLFFGLHAFRKEYKTRIKNEALEKENYKAELKYLKSQINPHFLFNTLNSLYVLALEKSNRTPLLIAKLSELFRYVLESSKEDLISLKHEIRLLKNYIDLEKIRYDDGLDFKLTIDVQDDKKELPPLLLLPIVENTFKHGASTSIKNAWIRIEIKQLGNMLEIKSINSLPEKRDLDSSRIGLGNSNLRERLKLQFGDSFSMNQKNEGHKYFVNLKIPLVN